ncbi:MAG TPA: hypothetical protein VF306_05080 [Pirellulales bacterium]
MRRTMNCGLFVVLATLAAWGEKAAMGQIGEEPRPATPDGGQAVVVETAEPNGVRREVRVFAPPGANAAGLAGQYVPFPIRLTQEDSDLQKLMRQEAELAQQSQSLVKRIAETENGAERTPLVNELEETINQQFDVQQQMRELEVARIEAKVKKLRETITKRSGARATIVRNRREQLLQEAEGLGWNSPEPAHAGGRVFYQPARDTRPASAARGP